MFRRSNAISLSMIYRSGKRSPKRSLTIALAFALCLAGPLPAGLLRVAHADVNQWTALGPEGGSIVAMAIDPLNSNVLYCSANQAGICKSTDSGATWASSSSGITMVLFPILRSIQPIRIRSTAAQSTSY